MYATKIANDLFSLENK